MKLKYASLFLFAALLSVPGIAQAAWNDNGDVGYKNTAPPGIGNSAPVASQGTAGLMKACPHTGAEAITNVDKSLDRGPGTERVTLLCLAEVVKNLQARVKELEAAKGK